ncbi:hypothetical protein NHX12_008025 [Muraenolepis orangiensis]|uniref:Sorting nexin 19 n=1 Tax=Muraenolepis orangiensis TaxID=630683 RepID=A0A9Q0I9T1_9TELE|nr:hypothetical protein NHX12_008025 [Muraenolepis orangiensis]
MAEVLGQRSLLGLGVLLAWLFLFHLLVNIWLLCVFTSLLVVLGGWLGSQAVLESNSLVHLERFINLKQISSSVEDEEQLDQEIQNTVIKIIRDFVSSWYSTISTERAFEIDVQEAMISMAMELKTRARCLDRKALSKRVLDLYGCHLQNFLKAKELVAEQPGDASHRLWKVYSELSSPHPAVKSAAVELNYTRATVDLLLYSLVPPPHLESRTGRFVVSELITCNVLLPFFSKLSDPDWLNENDSDLDSPLADYKRDSLDFLVMDGQDGSQSDLPRECATPTDGLDLDLDIYPSPVDEVLLNSRPLDQLDGCGPSCLRPAQRTPGINNGLCELDKEGSPVSANPARVLLLGLDQMGAGTTNELTTSSPLLVSSSPRPSFSFEPLSSPEGPVLIQSLRISGTITAKEHRGTGSHPYTLYTIKYETMVGCENADGLQPGSEEAGAPQGGGESPPSDQPVAYHMVNRRYSEFLNLQTRLEEKHQLRKLIKGVKGPKKIFPDMPFGNMDSDKIEARKGLLETFLKQLCAIPDAANSEEMQEFLALNTDARIAFVKKPFIVSRIDKFVVNAMDTLKTAFPRSEPQSPTEDNEGEMERGKMTSEKKTRSRLRFSNKSSPFVNGSDVRPQTLFCWEKSNTLFNGISLADLEAFVTGQERLIGGGPVCDLGLEREDCGPAREWEPCPRLKGRGQAVSEMALAEPALNIMCLLMRAQWSWLCTEDLQRTARMLFGTLINRWLDVSVANLTSTKYWVAYLRVIQEAVWPGGRLPTRPWPPRTELEKDQSRHQALLCLMEVIPDLISDLLGSDKYRLSWQVVLDSLQDQNINRHLVYCLFDLLLEVLFPDIPE